MLIQVFLDFCGYKFKNITYQNMLLSYANPSWTSEMHVIGTELW